MPIYDQSYRRYEARTPLHRVRFWPITREGLRLLLSRRLFLMFLLLCGLPFVGFAIYLYVVTQQGDGARMLPVGGPLFLRFYTLQMPLSLLLTTFAGAGLIAGDRRTGALAVYLSRPLTLRDYVAGKLGVLLALNLSITALPALLLYGAGLALLPEKLLTRAEAALGPAVALQGVLITVVVSLLALAVSAVSRSARAAGLAFFALLMLLDVVQALLTNIYDRPHFALISPQANLRALGEALLGGSAPALPWLLPAAALLLVGAGCLAVLGVRVRAVEIVT